MIGSPVTAQRTNSPGASTWNSPSRNRSLASPLRPSSRSNRFIARLIQALAAQMPVAAYRWGVACASAGARGHGHRPGTGRGSLCVVVTASAMALVLGRPVQGPPRGGLRLRPAGSFQGGAVKARGLPATGLLTPVSTPGGLDHPPPRTPAPGPPL